MSANAYRPVPRQPLAEPGPALGRANLKILAERQHWPAGALDACIDLEDRHLGWRVSWLDENTIPGFERPAGFRATLAGRHATVLDAADAVELEERMAAVPEHDYGLHGCAWCRAQLDGRVRRRAGDARGT